MLTDTLPLSQERRGQIAALERTLTEVGDEQDQIELRHYFARGMYAREMVIPAGFMLVGKIHRTETINVISKGRIKVATEHSIVEIQAPFTFVSGPGTKRVGIALEETVWTTIHATRETDLDRLEEILTAPSFEALDPWWKRWFRRALEWCGHQ